MNFLVDCEVGKPSILSTLHNEKLRSYRGVFFGKSTGHGIPGPFGGNPDVLIERVWEECGALAVQSTPHWENGYYGLARDPLTPTCAVLQKTQTVIDHCLALRKAGKNVAVLLDGEPGTGKSEALTQVAQALGGKSIRAPIGSGVRLHNLAPLSELLCPDVIILDDIDRGGSTETILSTIDALLRQGVAILASSNAKEELCDALRRAKRLDLHYVYEGCEKDLFEKVSADLPEEKKLGLEGQPLATVLRYVELYETLGSEPADALLKREKKRQQSQKKNPPPPSEEKKEEECA